MKLSIRGDKISVTSSMKTYITEHISKLDKYFENPDEINANILVKVKGINQTVEITAQMKKVTLRAEETNADFYAAVDLVIDKIESQIRKNKGRLKKKYHNLDINDFNFEYETEEEIETKIVKRKDITMKPMDEEEAILQLELLTHDFFVFKNIDEECVSVIYKRKDNDYGIINMK